MAQWGLAASWGCWDAGSIPSPARGQGSCVATGVS